MCGIIGVLLADKDQFVNQLLYDGLTVLQHRGQDAAGIVTTTKDLRLHLRKDNGLVRDVFQQHHMLQLYGNCGLGHVRYPTAGNTSVVGEAQPLYTNYPYGICVVHNGNLVNTEELTAHLRDDIGRHVNTDSDSELLLNLFAEGMTKEHRSSDQASMADQIFKAMTTVMEQCKGGYAGVYLINGMGLVGFRDPHGIRPLVFGCRATKATEMNGGSHAARPTSPRQMEDEVYDHVFASESVAIDTLGFNLVRDVKAGEVIFVDMEGHVHCKTVSPVAKLNPCIFEYVYFARPDSIMDGVSVYQARLNMGGKLAKKILKKFPDHDIDVVIPIPDTSRTSALQAAYVLDRPFREGFIKNRYIARTFIMPGQATRRKSVRLKLNTIKSEFAGKNVLLVDDSIVRGTTANEIVQMARDAGARKVYFTSAAPPIRYPNIYGIDIPTQKELVAFERDVEQVAEEIGSDWVVYQDLNDLEDAVTEAATFPIEKYEASCFSGEYVTGEKIGDGYFTKLFASRNDAAKLNALLDKSETKQQRQGGSGCESVNNDKRIIPRGDARSCETLTNNTNAGEVH
ncbi:hypothetical protein MPSEU_000344400 [Mayamaea pseudoterrestris]|nr:hypothetical protein MPSEU_000344400 [Mayamaea pseudoterrestris]